MNDIHDPLGDFSQNPEYMDKRVPMVAEAEMALEHGYDPNNAAQVEARRRELAGEERERLEFIRKIMVMKSGRKWIYNFMEDCSIFGNPFIQGDMYSTAFKLGEQNVGKKLLSDVQRFKDLYCLMMDEQN